MLMWRQLIKQKKKLYSVFNFVRNGLWTRGLKAKVGERTLISGIKVRESGGGNNKLYVGNDVKIQNCKITITGDNNRIYIGDNCSLRGTDFYIENDSNEIYIDDGTTTTNAVIISAIEGTKISIGKDCMISSDIYMSTGDGHTVCDKDSAYRTNISQNIEIGDHVWIGTRVIIGKGCKIGKNSIIAAGSVCTEGGLRDEKSNVIIGGNPARVMKGDVNWLRERI